MPSDPSEHSPWQRRPPQTPPAPSAAAVGAFVLGILAYGMCLGPFAALPAVALGLIARREAAQRGVGGRGYGMAGLVLGASNLALCALVTVMVLFTMGPSRHISVFPRPRLAPPTATPAPDPRSQGQSEEGGEMTTSDQLSELKVGLVTLVDVPLSVRALASELRSQREKARKNQEKMVVFVVSTDCRPCMSVAAVLPDAKLQAALEHVRLVRVDADECREELNELGISTREIPGFYLLGPDLHPVDGVTGAEWDDDTADNVAPVLFAWVRGAYKTWRHPFVAPEPLHTGPKRQGTPSPQGSGTFL